MQHITKLSLLTTLLISLSSAGGHITPAAVETEETTEASSTALNNLYNQYFLGGSKITLGDTYHKAFHFGSRTGYKFDNGISAHMIGESNYYRHIGDINEMALSALGLSYDVPFTANKLTLGVAAGLGTNLNYNRMLGGSFKKSYDFGFAYQADVSFNFNDKWSLNASYTKYDFNTNATQLEDTQPEIITVSFAYKFDAASLFN